MKTKRTSDPRQVRASEAKRREKGETPIKSKTIWVDSKHAESAREAINAAAVKSAQQFLK
jgi:hypothetical protein